MSIHSLIGVLTTSPCHFYKSKNCSFELELSEMRSNELKGQIENL